MTIPTDSAATVPSLPVPHAAPSWGPGPVAQPPVQYGGYVAPMQRFGSPGQVRSPGLVLLFSWITLGIYSLYMHYKLNAEMKAFTSTVNVTPILAVLAFLLPFGGLISTISTTGRIRQTQSAAGLQGNAGGFVTFLCMLVGAQYAYQQSQLNGVWRHVQAQTYPR